MMMMTDRAADRELSFETTTSSHHGSESDLVSSSSRPDTAGSSSQHDHSDPLTSQDPNWTVHHDLLLLSLIVTHRPVGPHKHFRILAIQHAMERGLPRLQGSPHDVCRVSVQSIWARLRELYDLDALEKVDTCPDEWPHLGTSASSLASTPATTPQTSAPLLLSASGDPLSPSTASISRRSSARLRASSTTTNSSTSSLPPHASIAADELPTWDPSESFSVPLEWLPAGVVPPPLSPLHSPRGLAVSAGAGGGTSSSSSLSGSGSSASSGGGARRKQQMDVPPKRGRGRPKGSGVKQRLALQVLSDEEGVGDDGSQDDEGRDVQEEDDEEERANEDHDPMDVDGDTSHNLDGDDNDTAVNTSDHGDVSGDDATSSSSSSSSDQTTPRKAPTPAARRGRPPKNPPPPPEPPLGPPKKRRGRPPKLRPPPPPEPDSPTSPSSPSSSESSSASSSSDHDDQGDTYLAHPPQTPTYPPALDPLGLEDGMVKVEEGPVGRRTRRAVAAHTEGSSAPSTAPVSPTSRVFSPTVGALTGLTDLVAGSTGTSGGIKRGRSHSPPVVIARKGRRVSESSVGEGREGSSSPPPAAGGRRKSRRSKQGEHYGDSGSGTSKRRSTTRRG